MGLGDLTLNSVHLEVTLQNYLQDGGWGLTTGWAGVRCLPTGEAQVDRSSSQEGPGHAGESQDPESRGWGCRGPARPGCRTALASGETPRALCPGLGFHEDRTRPVVLRDIKLLVYLALSS